MNRSRLQPPLAALAALLALAACGAAPPNLLLISVDTLRPDHLPSYGYARETAPALERLARGGVLWENAYAVAPATVASHASLFTGRLPYQHLTMHHYTPLPPAERTLAEILSEAGYRTFAVATSIRFHESSGFSQGFGSYEVLYEDPKNQRSRLATDRVLEIAAADDERPFFGFVHYFGPHSPYWPPEPWRSRWHTGPAPSLPEGPGAYLLAQRRGGLEVQEETLAYLEALYDAEILYLDTELARLLDGLDAAGVAADTLVVLVSDHGEEFREHGGLGHARTLYEESLRIPFLMRWPGGLPAGERVARPAQLVDVVPTVLELLGQPVPPALAGRSLVSDWSGRPQGTSVDLVLGQRGTLQWSASARLPEGRFKALFGEDAPVQLYDLDADPGERRNLAPLLADTVERLVAAAPEGLVGGLVDREAEAVPEEVRRRLLEIGYVEELESAPPTAATSPEPTTGGEP